MKATGRAALGTLMLGASLATPLGATGAALGPWEALANLRRVLQEQSPLTTRFLQTYLPTGFETGEQEEGDLAIGLPRCLRWDYSSPYPKSFLLCDDVMYYWSPGESTGQRYPIENEEVVGLDFFLLDTDQLRLRYNAAAERSADGSLEVVLEPLAPSEEVVRVQVVLDKQRERVKSLSYLDSEGNRTRFEIKDYRRGGVDPSRFAPPDDIDWEEP